jgi:hypothetical protein
MKIECSLCCMHFGDLMKVEKESVEVLDLFVVGLIRD